MRYWFALFVVMSSVQAMGQSLFSMESREDGRRWEGVGRLELAGDAFCTGALIDEKLVLTAAHCLFDPNTGARVPAEKIEFLAGWRNGRASAYRHVKRAVAHPDYDFLGAPDAARVRNDVALIELQHPIRNTTIVPFATRSEPASGDRVGVVSYAHDRSDAPSLQEYCEVLALQQGMVVMSCEVDFGASGSPVFSFDEHGNPKIVSVVSAKATVEDTPVSLGTSLSQPLQVLKVMLTVDDNPGVGLNQMAAGTRRDTGAKFVRP